MLRPPAIRACCLALVIACTVLAARVLPAAAADPATLPVGSPAPLFASEDLEGNPFTLAEALKDRPVLLVFWSIFCGSCLEELPIIEQEKPKFENQVQVVTVSLDEGPRALANLGQVRKLRGFTFRILMNKVEHKAPDGTVEKKDFQIDKAYNVQVTPALYLINRDGTIAYGHFGPLGPEELAEVVAKAK